MRLKDLCIQCDHFDVCRHPCQPVWEILERENPHGLKEYQINRDTYFIRNWDQKHFFVKEVGRETQVEDFADTPENHLDSTMDFPESSQTTRIFYLRIFKGKSLEEIAKELNCTKRHVIKMFHKGKSRALRVVGAMDAKDFCSTVIKNNSRLTDRQKLFIAHRIFGLSRKQCAEIFEHVPGDKTFSAFVNRWEKSFKEQYEQHGQTV